MEVNAASKVAAALVGMEAGHFSDSKTLTGGICERRIHSGPGYRIYYGIEDLKIVVLLLGGTKRSQALDIRKAKRMWHDYKTNKG